MQPVTGHLQLQDADGALADLLLHGGRPQGRTAGDHQRAPDLEAVRVVAGCAPREHLLGDAGEVKEGGDSYNYLGHQGRRSQSSLVGLRAHPPTYLLQSGAVLRAEHGAVPPAAPADPALRKAEHRAAQIHGQVREGHHGPLPAALPAQLILTFYRHQ